MTTTTTTMTARGRRQVNASIGLAVFLGATAMLFASLLLAYAVLRAQAPVWPPPGAAPLPRGLLGANTAVLLLASLALRRRRARAALGLGLAFVLLQALAWRSLVAAGAGPASGVYGGIFFALSGFHALHVLGGLIALALLVARPRAGGGALRLTAAYWDFVLAVWVVLYVGVCLL